MDFRADEDLDLLRRSVAGVAGKFGHAYFVEQARTGGSATELWTALADHGFVSTWREARWR